MNQGNPDHKTQMTEHGEEPPRVMPEAKEMRDTISKTYVPPPFTPARAGIEYPEYDKYGSTAELERGVDEALAREDRIEDVPADDPAVAALSDKIASAKGPVIVPRHANALRELLSGAAHTNRQLCISLAQLNNDDVMTFRIELRALHMAIGLAMQMLENRYGREYRPPIIDFDGRLLGGDNLFAGMKSP